MRCATQVLRELVFALASIACVAISSRTAWTDWTVTPRGAVALTAGSVTGIQEFSGVTYLGPADGGLERFAAIQDDGNLIVVFDVSVAADGALKSATAVGKRSIAPAADYEGIVFTGATRNTVFVSEESTPGVHEHSLVTGRRLQTVAVADIYSSRRSNKGFEALARSASGGVMWTVNEEALRSDGPIATQDASTVVRLQRIADSGTGTTAGPQYAYRVEPIHAGGIGAASGVTELVMLPDDTLLSLERSSIAGMPLFRSSIFAIDFDGATDISGAEFADGLVGKGYTPVRKKQLWSGQIGGAAGQGANFEGLTVGPRLANGNWLLLGVIDNGGPGAATPIVSFELVPSAANRTGR
ncbi:MAG: esterase-like activity of phytase family protein [Pirellulales bacterium]